MGVDMQHPDRALGADGFQDRQSDRMVAADAERNDALFHDAADELLDVLVAALE